MGTYIPMRFEPMCGTEYCKGGWDCHPNLMNSELEALFSRLNVQRRRPQECCYWSLNNAFEATLESHGGERPKDRDDCEYGAACYMKNAAHLLEYAHPGDRDPMFKP